jgi:SNF2 family DNA or RNA helicase
MMSGSFTVPGMGPPPPSAAPFGSLYKPELAGGCQPMPHQLETAGFLIANKRAYCTSDTRTGKTLACAMALDYLRRTEPGGTLIVCPLSVMDSAWGQSIRTADPEARVGLLRGSKRQRQELLSRRYPYYVINYDGLVIIENELRKLIMESLITKVVIDELNHFGNPSAHRYKVADRLFNSPAVPVKYMWGLTGTPGADSMAVFGMCKLINFGGIPWKSKSAWQAAAQIKWGSEAWQWKDRPEAPHIIKRVMQPTIRYTREEVLPSLPPVIHIGKEAAMSEEQSGYYDELKRDLIVRFERGDTVTADQKASLLSKLFQICAGVVLTDRGTVVLDNAPRVAMLKDLINETPKKTVIYCHFTAVIDDLVEKLGRDFTAVKVDGSVTGGRRDAVFKAFREEADPRVLIAHQKTVAYGTELAAADQLINNGPQMSGVSTYSQGLDRASSMEQSSDRISVIDVWTSPEEKMYMASLNARKRHSDIISNLFTLIGRGET